MIITSVKTIELNQDSLPISRAMFVTFCTHTRAHAHIYIYLSLSFSPHLSIRLGEWAHRCTLCRWGIEALSVVNTRVIIVAGHLGPQARHIRSLTIQSSRSKATANKLFRNNGDICWKSNSTRAVNLLNARDYWMRINYHFLAPRQVQGFP